MSIQRSASRTCPAAIGAGPWTSRPFVSSAGARDDLASAGRRPADPVGANLELRCRPSRRDDPRHGGQEMVLEGARRVGHVEGGYS